MPPRQGTPEDCLRFAYSDLDLAQVQAGPRVMLEMLCFHAQQAAEKAIKAVLLKHAIEAPRTHNLQVLPELLPASVPVPAEVAQATELSGYAVALRYPGESEPVTAAEHQQAVAHRVPDRNLSEHSGLEDAFLVGKFDPYLYCPRNFIHRRLNEHDLSGELAIRQRRDRNRGWLPKFDVRNLVLVDLRLYPNGRKIADDV